MLARTNRWIASAIGSLIVLVLVTVAALAASAAILGVSATFNGPTPNPVAAGATATANAQFSLVSDTGAITVSIELQAPTGFGGLRLDPSGTTAGLINCVESGAAVTCDWDGLVANSPQTLAVFLDVDGSIAPGTGANLVAIVTSATIPDTDVYANAGISTNPPIGTTSLSGTVITEGEIPVESACIFVLSSPLFIYQAITDSAGNWAINDLPDTYSFVVAAVPPFAGTFGPCANNGPPPIPGPGELQPVFFDDIWIDLSDPALTGGLGDPYVFAVNAGASVFTSSAAGIESCLSTAPPEANPRPLCTAQVATTTTTTTVGSTTTTASGASGPTTTTTVGSTTTTASGASGAMTTIPLTGINPAGRLVIGSLLLVFGTGILFAVRRSWGTKDR